MSKTVQTVNRNRSNSMPQRVHETSGGAKILSEGGQKKKF